MNDKMRAVVLDVPEAEIERLKQHLEDTKTDYIIHDAGPFYRDLMHYMMKNGFDSDSIMEWTDELDMDEFVKTGAIVKRQG